MNHNITTFIGLPHNNEMLNEGDTFLCTFTGFIYAFINREWTLTQHTINPLNYINQEYLEDIDLVTMLSFEESGGLEKNEKKNLKIGSRKFKSTNQRFSECTICQDNYELEDSVCTLKCKHVFHRLCIKEWGKYKQECPICRSHIYSNIEII
jgi:hypothetical protein